MTTEPTDINFNDLSESHQNLFKEARGMIDLFPVAIQEPLQTALGDKEIIARQVKSAFLKVKRDDLETFNKSLKEFYKRASDEKLWGYKTPIKMFAEEKPQNKSNTPSSANEHSRSSRRDHTNTTASTPKVKKIKTHIAGKTKTLSPEVYARLKSAIAKLHAGKFRVSIDD